ncbi:glutamyl-tRNA reductase [Aureispira anguillae]|uniref:Glutamyl-tRNA reductase n=1 Tax=Aureispira anguillae TaxID=2864201 RepID=A0A915YL02_9BACT|nr:glutamyl-tRNA reductase [Aureispira anguillae]BDS14881.1 glutamyl-tRNA reductase [Aureispira anguillae]
MDTLSSYKILTITHKSTTLKSIGNFVLPDLDSEHSLQQKLQTIQEALGLDELLYLATCNRVLFFFTTAQPLNDRFLTQFESVVYPDLPETISLKGAASTYSGNSAITHLLEVASSVDSLVIGEREILRQLREAYERCFKVGSTGDSIRMAMQLAVEVAKKVYSTTRIGQKAVSVVSLAIRQLLAKNPPRDARVLIVGAGQTNTLVGKFLAKYGFQNCVVFNRSLGNAQTLATMLGGAPYALSDLPTYKGGFDILIACTGSTNAIITPDLYQTLLQGDTGEKILIDLSIPNNIDTSIAETYNTTYIEIDGLKELVNENLAFREKEVTNVQAIINERVGEFKKIYKGRQVEIALREVPTQIKAIRQHALTSVFKNEVSSLDDDVQELIDRMMAYMEKRCIAIPIQVAKEHLAGVVSSKKI